MNLFSPRLRTTILLRLVVRQGLGLLLRPCLLLSTVSAGAGARGPGHGRGVRSPLQTLEIR